MPTLIKICKDVLKTELCPIFCLSDRDFALRNNLMELFEHIEAYIMENMKQVGETSQFKSCNFEYIDQLISSNDSTASE